MIIIHDVNNNHSHKAMRMAGPSRLTSDGMRRLRLFARVGHDLTRPLERCAQIAGQILVAEAVKQSRLLQDNERLRMHAREDERGPSPLRLRLERLERPEA